MTDNIQELITDTKAKSEEMVAFANVLTDDDGDKYNCNLTLECFDGRLVVSIDNVPNLDVYFNWCVIQQAQVEE